MASLDTWLISVLTTEYCILAVIASVQVFRILFYKHRLLSFQFAFLALTLFWCILRIVFFVDFLAGGLNSTFSCAATDVIYWIPINIEFATFCLLVLFFASVIHRNTDRARWEDQLKRRYIIAYISVNVLLLGLSTIWVAFDCSSTNDPGVSTARSIISGSAFLILDIFLAVYSNWLRTLAADTKVGVSFGAQVHSTMQMLWMSVALVVIFTLRGAYDFVYLIPGFNPVFQQYYAIFYIILYTLAEIMPALIVLYFFRRIPKTKANLAARPRFAPTPSRILTRGATVQGEDRPFFNNNNRYDSDDDYVASPADPTFRLIHSPTTTRALE